MPTKQRSEKNISGRWGKTAASQQRRQAMIAAAKAVFFEEGYQLASMERLAEVAGTTKRTLYDHFGSKEALFAASIGFGCQLFVDQLPKAEDLPPDAIKGILGFIDRLTALLNAPDVVRFLRMVIAEAERHPQFGEVLNQAAFVAAEDILRDYLTRQVHQGRMKPHDLGPWAHCLIGLATNLGHTQTLLGVRDARPDGRAQRVRRQIVEAYVGAHVLS
jgi:TetR/AcrR family transcriptional repressor of mexJK operon